MSSLMRPVAIAVLFASAALTSGCEIIGPSVKVEPPKVRIPAEGGPPGQHCPPGQAKKGRC
jgi:hypothetical protein